MRTDRDRQEALITIAEEAQWMMLMALRLEYGEIRSRACKLWNVIQKALEEDGDPAAYVQAERRGPPRLATRSPTIKPMPPCAQ